MKRSEGRKKGIYTPFPSLTYFVELSFTNSDLRKSHSRDLPIAVFNFVGPSPQIPFSSPRDGRIPLLILPL